MDYQRGSEAGARQRGRGAKGGSDGEAVEARDGAGNATQSAAVRRWL